MRGQLFILTGNNSERFPFNSVTELVSRVLAWISYPPQTVYLITWNPQLEIMPWSLDQLWSPCPLSFPKCFLITLYWLV